MSEASVWTQGTVAVVSISNIIGDC